MDPMSILRIREFPDDVLIRKAEPVANVDGRLQALIGDMFDTLYAAPGLGLAAPQVGAPLRFFVYDPGIRGGGDEGQTIRHPTSVQQEGERAGKMSHNHTMGGQEGGLAEEEGCLSIPD